MQIGHIIRIAALPALLAAPALAQAQTAADRFPASAVKIIVPYPAGGPVDLMTRTLAQKLSEDWKQPVIIENRAGGNSTVGAIAGAHARPDGYTLLVAMDTTLVYNLITLSKPPYDLKDFAPISLTTNNTPLVIVPASGPKSIKELIA